MSLRYVRDTYHVPARRGARVTVNGREGVIMGANHRLLVLLDGEAHPVPCHPTWAVRYHDDVARASHDSRCVDDTCDACDVRHDPEEGCGDEC